MDLADQERLEALRPQAGRRMRRECTSERSMHFLNVVFVHESLERNEQLLTESHPHRSRICRILGATTDCVSKRMSDE
jgi:hypothetical protein